MKSVINIFLIIIGSVGFLSGQIVTVGMDNGAAGSLRQQIETAPAGSTITFASIITSVNVDSEIMINKDITISGVAGLNVLVDGGGSSRIFNITDGEVELNNLTLVNGLASDGGAIFNSTMLTLNDCVIDNSSANGMPGSGGAIFNDVDGVLVVNNSSFSGNTAVRAGGAIEDNSGAGLSVTLNNVTFTNNSAGSAPGNGGAFHITGAGDATISDCVVDGNNAASEGGGLWNGIGTMTVTNTSITGNTVVGDGADQGGGGIFNAGGTLLVTGGEIRNNATTGTSTSGGGILNDKGTLSVTSTIITANSSVRAGGGIEDNSEAGNMLTLTAVTLRENTTESMPGNGGGLHITGAGDSTVDGCMVDGNTASAEGGGLWNGTGTMVVSNTSILNNSVVGDGADQGGGGIFNAGGTLVVNGGDIINNTTTGTSTSGGGILNDKGILTVTSTNINSNSSVRAGGGIEDNSEAGNMLTLTAVALRENTTESMPGNGGGLHITGAGDSTVDGCMVDGNTASAEGGGLWNGTGTMTVSNSAILNNSAVGDGANQGGGGIFNAGGTLLVIGGEIRNNSTTGTSTSGGGILNDMGTLSVTDIEITGNTSIRAGGGIEDNSIAGNTLVLSNVTLSENSTASSPGNGGGLHITGPGDSMIDSCTVTSNEAAAEGGGLWNGTGVMVVNNTTVTNNTVVGEGADQGGAGLFNAGGTLSLEACVVSDNSTSGSSTSGGGILNDLGVLSVTNTTISGNASIRAGGGIEDNSASGNMLTLINVTLSNNTTGASPGNGGGLHITGPGDSMIADCLVSSNSASSEGGGLWNGSGIMTVSNTEIDSNVALGAEADHGGGGVFNNGGTLNINNETIISNNLSNGASGSGGGLLSTAGEVTIENTSFTGNSANRAGGAIELIDGNLNFSSSTMIDNDVNGTAGMPAPGNGGGFHVTGNSGMMLFVNSSFTGNQAGREGGAIWNQAGAQMTIDQCTIDGNSSFGAMNTNGGAGVFNNSGILEIRNSTISNNSDMGEDAAGAGVHNKVDGEIYIFTSTISNNSSSTGGGIYNNGNKSSINSSTIAYNNAAVSGGGIQGMTEVELMNTIVASNTSPDGSDLAGTSFFSLGYNLIGSSESNIFVEGIEDLVNVDAMLNATLEVGAQGTATHKLQSGSPAYNAADPTDNSVDQNGQAVFDGRRDIGADESQSDLTSVVNLTKEESDIDVFPNPSVNEINVEIPTDFGDNLTITINSASTGVLLQNITTQTGMNTIDLSDYPTGMYVIKMQSEKYSYSQLISKI